jgi:hypothetical protein
MIKTCLKCLGVYGGGADEQDECRGWMYDSSVCHCSLSHMDKLHVLLISPRSNVSLLDGSTSTSMLRKNLERMLPRRTRWRLRQWWSYPSSEDEVHGIFHRALLHNFTNINSHLLPGFSCWKKNAQTKYMKDKNCNKILGIFREGSEARIFLSGLWGLWTMNLGACTCKWMRGLPQEDRRRGPQKEARLTGPGRLTNGLCYPNWVGSSPTFSLLHYVLVGIC